MLAQSFLSSGSNFGNPFFSAVKGGADRIEVCANIGIGGGTTPTLGLLKSIQNVVDVPIMVRHFFLQLTFFFKNKKKNHILSWGFFRL